LLRYSLLVTFLILINPGSLLAQEEEAPDFPLLWIDCTVCDMANIRTNVTFVRFASEADNANIELFIEDLRLPGSGREFILNFTGKNKYSGIDDTLRYISPAGESENERRNGLNRIIKIGLIPYVKTTDIVQAIDIFYNPGVEDITEDTEPAEEAEQEREDPWKNWVFDLNARASLSGERTRRNVAVFGSAEAENITEEHKLRIRLRGEDIRNRIERSGGTINVNRSWGDLVGTQVFSLNDHFAIGFFEKISFSSFNNINFNIEASPAVEFNAFSYSTYSSRRLLFRYRVTPSYRKYDGRTIFNKTEEFIGQQNLTIDFRIDRGWGRLTTEISGSQFFHDTDLNRLEVDNTISFNVLRGLSVSITGRYSLINDQIAVLAGDATEEEALLDLRRRATSEAYGISLGLSFTFGALSNTAVNRRF